MGKDFISIKNHLAKQEYDNHCKCRFRAFTYDLCQLFFSTWAHVFHLSFHEPCAGAKEVASLPSPIRGQCRRILHTRRRGRLHSNEVKTSPKSEHGHPAAFLSRDSLASSRRLLNLLDVQAAFLGPILAISKAV